MSEDAICKIPPTVGFHGAMRIGTIMCLEQEGEQWDPCIVVGMNTETSVLHVIAPQMMYDSSGQLLFGEDRTIVVSDVFNKKDPLTAVYISMMVDVEMDAEGNYYVEDSEIQIVFPSRLDGIVQRKGTDSVEYPVAIHEE